MISDEKMTHIVHLMLDGIEKAGLARFPQKDEAIREAKKVGTKFLSRLNKLTELVENRIQSQKNAPPRYSPQWDNLFQKYLDEEMRKLGGG